jgi:RNA recognition motif-containing protein
MGRTIKVEFSRSFRKPAPLPPIIERHKLYVSNLPWKARAPNVKEFFAKFNPLSANVIFDNGKAAGYCFVSFGTKEEAEAALTELDGKVLHTNFSLTFFSLVKIYSIPPSTHAST